MTVKIDPTLLAVLAHQEAYDAGIVPPDTRFHHDMRRALSQLPPEESLKLRRKFRKLWRKLARGNQGTTVSDLVKSSETSSRTGLGCKNPTQSHSVARKSVVHWEMYRRARKKAAAQ
jgi:hypothetical protein